MPESDEYPIEEIEKKKEVPLSKWGFNRKRLFTEDILSKLSNTPGVYVLSVTENIHTYTEGRSGIVYIGSTKNLKKRLAAYFNGFGHTNTIKQFIKNNSLKFCYCDTADFKAAEARLIHYFKDNMGELPLLNKLKPHYYKNNPFEHLRKG